MPLSEATLPGDEESDPTNSMDPGEIPGNDDKQDQIPEPVDVPQMPHDPKATIVGHGPDGSAIYSDGITVTPDGANFRTYPDGSKFSHIPGMKPQYHAAPPPKPDATVVADETGPDGIPYKVIINKTTGTSTRVQGDPGSRPAAQAEMMRIRILNAAKSQPAIVGYINVKNNYDSLSQNAAIPPKDRTAADDAAAIQAFGAIEHPGTGVTDADKKQAQELVPVWTALGIKMNNWSKNKSNLLDSGTVNQMRDAAKRALDGRQKTYNEQLAPLLKEAERVGLHPNDVNGALGANIADYPAPSVTPQPSAAPAPAAAPDLSPAAAQKWVTDNQSNPDPAVQAKVRAVILKLQTGQ